MGNNCVYNVLDPGDGAQDAINHTTLNSKLNTKLNTTAQVDLDMNNIK